MLSVPGQFAKASEIQAIADALMAGSEGGMDEARQRLDAVEPDLADARERLDGYRDALNVDDPEDAKFAGKATAVIFDTGGAEVNIEASSIKALVSDGDWTAALGAAANLARAERRVLNLVDREDLLITSALNLSDVFVRSRGARIYSTTAETLVNVTGSGPGTYHTLAADAPRGNAYIESAALAAVVQRGDHIVITSDAMFVTGGTTAQGEMAVVSYVSGSRVSLEHPLHDTYLVSNSARAAVASLARFEIDGDLHLEQIQSSNTDLRFGLQASYVDRLTGRIRAEGCSRQSVLLQSCWAPHIDLTNTDTQHTQAARTSYGVNVSNATMFARVEGTILGARHAVTSGGSSSVPGVSWGTRVSVVARGWENSAVLDCHGDTGSMRFEGCDVMAGAGFDKAGTARRANGYNVGARYTEIVGGTIRHPSIGINVRADLEYIEELTVRDVRVLDGQTWAFDMNSAVTIRKLRVEGLTGRAVNGLRFNVGSVEKIERMDFDLECQTTGLSVLAGCTVPARLDIEARLRRDTPETSDTNVRGININNAGVKEIDLRGSIQGYFYGMRTHHPLDVIDVDADMRGNVHHLWQQGVTAHVEVLKLDGHMGAADNVIGGSAGMDVRRLLLSPTLVADGVTNVVQRTATRAYVAGKLGGATVVATSPGDTMYVSGGDIDDPVDLFGTGSPEGKFAARIGATYRRLDGGAGTSLYIKESGTGTSGWVAK